MGERARELLVPRLNYFTQGLDTADLVEARATLDGIPFAAGGTQAR
jgi:hypothetical protein